MTHTSVKNVTLSKYRPTTLKKAIKLEISKFSNNHSNSTKESLYKLLSKIQDLKLNYDLQEALRMTLNELDRINFKVHLNIKLLVSQIFDLKSTMFEYCPTGCTCIDGITLQISHRLNDHRLGFLPAGLFTKKMYSSIKMTQKLNNAITEYVFKFLYFVIF